MIYGKGIWKMNEAYSQHLLDSIAEASQNSHDWNSQEVYCEEFLDELKKLGYIVVKITKEATK